MEHNRVVSHIKDYPMGPILNGMVTDWWTFAAFIYGWWELTEHYEFRQTVDVYGKRYRN